MDKVKPIVQWVLVALLAILVFTNGFSISSLLFLLGIVVLLPIKKSEEILEKFNLTFVTRIFIAVICLVIGMGITPGHSENAEKENVQNASSDNKEDGKKDDKDNKDDNKDSKENSKAEAQIIGKWHYGESAAIDMYYTFYEDGTWDMESENDDSNSGTYEIVDGKTIKMKGSTEDRTFTIKNSDNLTDEAGFDLTRY